MADKRHRRTKANMAELREAIYKIVEPDPPMTVRQVFYQLVNTGLIEKTEREYSLVVVRLVTKMRLDGELRWGWIEDDTRRREITQTFNSVAEAVKSCAKFYRKSALDNCDDYVEIWIEKDALSGFVWDVASDYDVPVLSSRGTPSITLVYKTAEFINFNWEERGRSSYIYQFGDHDPTGAMIPKSMEKRLREFCPDADFTLERVALTPGQVAEYSLPTRPTKREGNRHADRFEGDSVELDALPPRVLKQMVREVIERHIDPHEMEVLREAEESERRIINLFAKQARGLHHHIDTPDGLRQS